MKFVDFITLTDVIWVGGVMTFGGWLLNTSLGRKALADSVPRRNNMPFYLPFIPLFIWFGPVSVIAVIVKGFSSGLPEWQQSLLINLIYCIGGLVVTALIILLARFSFARRLKGFGLNAKTIVKDFLTGVVNLFAVWPLVIAMIILTTLLGKLAWGYDFEMQQHQELELITEHSQLLLRISIIFLAVVIAPVLEELLFRGLFQSMLRGVLKNAWMAIALISVLFAMLHPWTHWPALFTLSMCLGYAYEKSGSLLRPIFIHALFNGITIIAALYQ
jgi:membrane protease YdiL (CAAX protease family)